MKKIFTSYTVTTGLAVFAMFFGAGNLIFPLVAGMQSGNQTPIAMVGFFITAVFLPLIGLIAMILFEGNYEQFFNRIGHTAGAICIWSCMMIIGPLIVIPRITTVSHEMISPFIPIDALKPITPLTSFLFALFFLSLTYIITHREKTIIEILGNILSPIKLITLTVIFFKGLWSAQTIIQNTEPTIEIFKSNLLLGYQTLDLIGALFFASIILHILKKTLGHDITSQPRALAWIALKAGLIGVSLLGIVYIAMSIVGAYHGHGCQDVNAGGLFREVCFKILGSYGTALFGIAIAMACLSTAIALSAIVAEYTQLIIFKNRIGFSTSLLLILIACIPLSTVGLGKIIEYTGGPITYIGYPVLITITLCNLAYKLFGFKPIKVPVLATLILACISYLS